MPKPFNDLSPSAKRKRARKEAGLCYLCPNFALPKLTVCEICRKEKQAYEKQNRLRRKAEGRPIKKNISEETREKDLDRGRRKYKKNRETIRNSQNSAYAMRKQEKLCTLCMGNPRPALPGQALCEEHRMQKREYSRKHYANLREQRKCVDCSAPTQPHSIRCEKHEEEMYMSQLVSGAKERAEKKNIPFTLTKERVVRALRAGVCEITGLPFQKYPKGLPKGQNRSPWAPSLDRRIPSLGYTDENTRLVIWLYNSAKFTYTDEDVLKMAQALVGKKGPHNA